MVAIDTARGVKGWLAGDIDMWMDAWMDLVEGNTGMWMHE